MPLNNVDVRLTEPDRPEQGSGNNVHGSSACSALARARRGSYGTPKGLGMGLSSASSSRSGSGSGSTLEVPAFLPDGTALPPGAAVSLTRRRLSHVSEAVSRRLSTTIGWRTAVSTHDVVEQAKSLCSQYIRSRMRRSGIFNRKLGLQRLRSVVNMTVSYGTCDVFTELNSLGKELEQRHPKLYNSVCRNMCMTITSEELLHNLFTSIATELFCGDITWGKLVALFAITGGLAADCVRQGHVDFILCLIESVGIFVDRHLAMWIAHQGGWNTLLTCFKPKQVCPPRYTTYILVATAAGVTLFFFMAIVIYLKYTI